MVTIKALWRDGKTPQAQAANVGRIDDELLLLRDGRQYRYRLADIRLEAGVADLPDTVQLPDGGTLEVADRIAIRRLIGGLSWGDRSGHWLQQSWRCWPARPYGWAIAICCRWPPGRWRRWCRFR